MTSRRAFVGALGASAAAGMLPPVEWTSLTTRPARGLAAAGDFLLEPGLVYVQTGSLGPSPRVVLQETMRAWEELERNPTAYGYGAHEQQLDLLREQAAAFIGCERRELTLTTSTTDGLNRVASALSLTAGDRVLTTDQEHPGGRSCWDYLAKTRGVVIDVVPIAPGPFDASAFLTRVRQAITPRTRVLSMAHVLSSTGVRLPVAELCAMARERDILSVIDGAQAVGGIAVNVRALGCDVYATSGHKWMLAPKGTGLLYIRSSAEARVPLISRQQGENGYTGATGVTNLPGAFGMRAALEFLASRGMSAVEAHNLALRDAAATALRAVKGLELVSDEESARRSPLLSYRLPTEVPAGALAKTLHEKHRVYVKVVPGNWFNGQRLSWHLFNDEADVRAVFAALRAELG